jgi:hypothetical protein
MLQQEKSGNPWLQLLSRQIKTWPLSDVIASYLLAPDELFVALKRDEMPFQNFIVAYIE